jgi:hypothetical protein
VLAIRISAVAGAAAEKDADVEKMLQPPSRREITFTAVIKAAKGV